MLHSIRARLTAWHTLTLAVVLLAFGALSYAFLARLTRERAERALADAARSFAHAFREEVDDDEPVDAAARHAAREFRYSGRRLLVYDRAHRLVAISDSAAVRPELGLAELESPDRTPLRALLDSVERGRAVHATLASATGPLRAYAVNVSVAETPYCLVVLQLDRSEDVVLADFRRALALAIPLALLLAGLGGYALARRSLAPVVAMSEQAQRIGAESLGERLPVVHARDELGRLAAVFNGLLARLERAFQQQRQFMADASHELRTPVAILRAEGDVALSRADRSRAEYRESLLVMRDEARRLSRIVDDLFTLARADARQLAPRRAQLYMEELLSDAVRALRSVADAGAVTLAYAPTEEAPFEGDADMLLRAVLNLLDNAVKHTPPGGRVTVELARAGAVYEICVHDTGAGIPPEAQPHVFDRFYRADPVRSRPAGGSSTAGAGLGLPIARWIAEAHGGTLRLLSSGPEGSSFVLQLPAPQPAPAPPATLARA